MQTPDCATLYATLAADYAALATAYAALAARSGQQTPSLPPMVRSGQQTPPAIALCSVPGMAPNTTGSYDPR